MIVTIFKNIKTTSAGFHRDVFQILKRIKEGKSKNLIDDYLKEFDPEKKGKLPSICFSGTFNQRADDKMIKHSGLICLDFDKYENKDIMEKQREKLISYPYTFALFTSPSGNGHKVLVKIPPEYENHRSYFKSLQDYYDSPYFDPVCMNESRVCYESYDPKIYINKDSKVWDTKYEFQHYQVGYKEETIRVKSTSKIIQNLLTWQEKNFPMIKG